MRRIRKTIGYLVVVLVALLVVQTGCTPPAVQSQIADAEQRTLSVSGSGTISAAPDSVVLRLGVETMAETVSAALSQNNAAMEAVINVLQDAGIPAEDIQTQTVRLNPQYETPPEPPRREPGQGPGRELVAYEASNIVEARTGDLDAVGEILDAAVGAGANRIDGLRFEVSNPEDLLSRARDAAWENAVGKAEQLADLAGAELGAVLSINESTRAPRPVAYGGGAVERESAVPIESGSENLQVDLQVTWMLR